MEDFFAKLEKIENCGLEAAVLVNSIDFGRFFYEAAKIFHKT